ncbi:unnamed protein product, partial [Didymodactylos carnosus]
VTVITFDDILVESSRAESIPNGYKNLTWSEAGFTNAISNTKSGYRNGLVSGQFVGMTYDRQPLTITSDRLFILKLFWATAAWNDNLTLAITGSSGGKPHPAFTSYSATHVVLDDWALEL